MNDDGDPSVENDLRLVRSALLYADKVELISPSATMLGSMTAATYTQPTLATDVLRGLDDEVIRYLQQGQTTQASPDQMREAIGLVARIKALTRDQRKAIYKMPGGEELHDIVRGLDASAVEMNTTIRSMWATAGGTEIEEALAAGVLDIRTDSFPLDGSIDHQVASFAETLKSLMECGTSHLLLDDSTSNLARSMRAEGAVHEHPFSSRNSRRVQAGTGFAERLPAFPNASVSSVLEAKRDLAPALHRYRVAMRQLADQLVTASHDPVLSAELDDYWRDEIVPALDAIRRELSTHQLARDMASEVSSNASPAIVGTAWAASIWMTLHSAALAVVPAALGSVGPAVKKAMDDRAETRERDLFYLYEINNRLL